MWLEAAVFGGVQVVERGGDGCIVVNGEVMLEGAGVELGQCKSRVARRAGTNHLGVRSRF